jgi:hypothetical protein
MNSNFIEMYSNALSDKSCDYIVNSFEDFKEHAKSGRMGYGVDKDKKDSIDMNLVDIKHKLDDDLLSEIKTSLKNNINKYTEKYKLVYDMPNIWDFFSIFPYEVSIKKYIKNTGGYHIFHSDNFASGVSIFRQLVCMYYLNTVDEGGETEFYHQRLKIMPRRGTLVIFPTYFTHMHKGHVPLSNDKYILNFWLMKGIDDLDKIKEKNGFTLD